MITTITSHAPRPAGPPEALISKPPQPQTRTPAPIGLTPNASQTRLEGTDESRLREAVAIVEQHVASLQRTLAFDVDQQTGRTVVTVSDRETGEIIRQIPAQEALALAARLQEATTGFLLAVEA